MEHFKIYLNDGLCYLRAFIKWVMIALIVGVIGGLTGSLFHITIDYALSLRSEYKWVIFFMPLVGVGIAGVYALFKSMGVLDTNRVLRAAETGHRVPLIMTPLIFISTVLTQLVGGSAGKEGAALQLGGSIGYNIGKLFKLKEKALKQIVMSGMAGVFSALFGTPIAAAFFAVEVSCVGVMHYASLVPAVIASVTGFYISTLFKIPHIRFGNIENQALSPFMILKLLCLAVMLALVSIAFCLSLKIFKKTAKRYLKNRYLRAFSGGLVIVALTLVVGNGRYNGAGLEIIVEALGGEARYYDFLLKIIFTVITVGVGFKGGEIVPAFFIGSTFGCSFGALLGLNPSFAASIGFTALFCGVVNCPAASVILAVEVFGGGNIIFYALAVAVCYMLSGKTGLYKAQKLLGSKIEEE